MNKKKLQRFFALFIIFTIIFTNVGMYLGEMEEVEAASIKATVTATSLNVRKGPGTSYSILKQNGKYVRLSKGTTVTINSTKGKWYYISFTYNKKSLKGYVSSSYLKKQTSTTTKSKTTTKGTVTASTLNVRKGAGTSYGLLKQNGKSVVLKKGASVTINSTKGSWYYVTFTYNKKTLKGYVSSKYIKKNSTSSSSSSTNKTTTTKGTVTASTLNVRKGAGTSYAILKQNGKYVVLKKGATVSIISTKGSWYYISFTYGGKTLKGYVSSKYIKKTIASATKKPAATVKPTVKPTIKPAATVKPTVKPTTKPVATVKPTVKPTTKPVATVKPTVKPTTKPTVTPTAKPVTTVRPTETPTTQLPVVTATPVPTTQVPVTSESPAVTNVPSVTPGETSGPAESLSPGVSEEPVTSAGPINSEQPVVTSSPENSEEPVVTSTPEGSNEPVTSALPQPTDTSTPETSIQPSTTNGPLAGATPSGTPSPVITKKCGIDVSKYQTNIDWKKVKASGIDFAFIRVGYRGYEKGTIVEDPYAKKNLEGAIAAGVDVGVYFYSTAITVAEAKEEAKWVCDYIDKYKITYPVVFDYEGYELKNYRCYNLSKSLRMKLAVAFLDYVAERGYTPMFYNSKNALENHWDMTVLESKYKIWVAQYPSNYTSSSTTSYKGKYDIWQYSSTGRVNGINGNVDMNIEYIQ